MRPVHDHQLSRSRRVFLISGLGVISAGWVSTPALAGPVPPTPSRSGASPGDEVGDRLINLLTRYGGEFGDPKDGFTRRQP